MTTLQIIAAALTIFIVGYCSGFNYAYRLSCRRQEYIDLYKEIEKMIRTYPKNKWNYDTIENRLIDLGQLKHKNHEQTEILTILFWVEHKEERLIRLLQSKN